MILVCCHGVAMQMRRCLWAVAPYVTSSFWEVARVVWVVARVLLEYSGLFPRFYLMLLVHSGRLLECSGRFLGGYLQAKVKSLPTKC